METSKQSDKSPMPESILSTGFLKKKKSANEHFDAYFHPLPFERFYDMKKCKCKKIDNSFRGGSRIRCQERADGYFLFRTTRIYKPQGPPNHIFTLLQPENN